MPDAAMEGMSMQEKNQKAIEFIEDVTRRADAVQLKVLDEILTRNACVEYLGRHGLQGRTDRDSFKKSVPVIKYEDISPDINRIAEGDSSPIFSASPVSEFLTSSGTSGGERKLMPTIEEELDRRTLLYSLLMPVMSQHVAGLDKGKGMYFLFIKSEASTPSGLPARPVLTSYYKSKHFRDRPFDPYTNYTSPNEAILCPDSYQSMYSQMLCGLLDRHQVLRVGAVFASGFIRAIKFLENNWPALVRDIRTGTLGPEVVDPSVRAAVGRVLSRPDPGLADYVEYECSKQAWQGIITRLWPNTKYIDVIVTGSMSQYIPTLEFYGNGLPLVCTMYASSECYFGLNLNPMCKPDDVAYTLIPSMAYFEFLPVQRSNGAVNVPNSLTDKEQSDLLDLVDLKLGHEYELVITTYAGLYRYRVGDVLRVAGFKNKAPQLKFICRKNVVLSIDADKTDEVELQAAVKSAAKHLEAFGSSLLDYTSHADASTVPGHYVLYWELSPGPAPIPPSAFEDCCLAVEESLNSVYRQGRAADNSIGPLQIKLLQPGSFDKLMDLAITLGASINQYKTPRCVTYAPILELLDSRAVASYRSPKCPKWLPGHNQWSATP